MIPQMPYIGQFPTVQDLLYLEAWKVAYLQYISYQINQTYITSNKTL